MSEPLYPRRYSAGRAADRLGDPAYRKRAAQIAEEIRSKDGVEAACDALEEFLAEPGRAARPRTPAP